MSNRKLPAEPLVRPLTGSYKLVFLFAAGVGLAAIGAAATELLELDLAETPLAELEQMTRGEAWIALVVGVLMQPFAWTGLLRGQLRLDERSLQYTRLGPVCTLASVDLDNIRRFGTGLEKHGYQRFHVLVLELRDGSKRSIKVSMYSRWRELVEALGLALGQEAVEGKRGWTGIHLEDAD